MQVFEDMIEKFRLFGRISAALLVVTSAVSGYGVALASPPVGEAIKLAENFNPHVQLIETMKDGEAFVNNMYREADRLNDYSLSFETKTFRKGSTVVEAGNLYFKKPKLMRLEETGEFNRGAVAVLGKDGKARAHAGGLASVITVTMNPDDKMLDAANGDRMEDSDFASLAKVLVNRLKQGAASRVSEKPVAVAGINEPAYILEIFMPNDPKVVLKRIFVNPGTNLPVRWDDYDYKDPCLSVWKDVKTNIGLKDDLFKL